jgi:hypothetical protein
MNVFTTDHPLASGSSWFDTKEHPRLSFVCSAVLWAMILTPFVVVRLYNYAISDIGAEPNPFPEPFWALVVGSVLAFTISLVCVSPFLWVYRTIVSRRSKFGRGSQY